MRGEPAQRAQEAEPPDGSPTFEDADPKSSPREDNERLVGENAARAHAERRARSDDAFRAEALENARELYRLADEMEDVDNRFETIGQSPIESTEERLLKRTNGNAHPQDAYHQALESYQGDNPYEAMRMAAMEEYAAFSEQQDRFDERIEKAPDLDAQHSLEQQKEIHAAEHLSATHHRIADQTEILTGTSEGEEVIQERERGAQWEDLSRKVQQSFRQRTGLDPQAEGLSDEIAARHQASTSTDKGTSSSKEISDWWEEAGFEVTASQREKLEALEDGSRGGNGGSSPTPTRPRDGGQSY